MHTKCEVSLSRVPRSNMALILSLSLRHRGITGLPVDEKPDLIRVAAADAAVLVGLLLDPRHAPKWSWGYA